MTQNRKIGLQVMAKENDLNFEVTSTNKGPTSTKQQQMPKAHVRAST